MPVLLDRSPILPHSSEVVVRGERVPIKANQVIIWVTLTAKRTAAPNPSALPFPAVLDTGNNHTFAIRERHLIGWAGLRTDTLPMVGNIRDRGSRIPLREVQIWLHPNVRGERDQLADTDPHIISAPQGIAVYPAGSDFPRLPILGLRAIAENELVLKVDGRRRQAMLRTAVRWWPFP